MKTIIDIIKKIKVIYTLREQLKFAFLFILIVFSGFLELLGISLILPFINIVVNPSSVTTNKYLSYIYTFFNMSSVTTFLVIMSIILIVVYIFKNLYILFLCYYQYKVLYDAQKSISLKLIKFYVSQPYEYHLNLNTSEMLRIITQDTLNCSIFLTGMATLLTELVVMLFIIIFLFFINKIITIVLVSFFCIIFLGIFKKLKSRLMKISIDNQKYHSAMIKWIQQSLGAVKDIKIFQKEKFFVNKYYDNSIKFTSAQKHFRFLDQIPRLLIESIVVVIILLVIIFLLLNGIDASKILVQMAVFAMAAFRLMPSMNRIQNSINTLMYYSPSINSVYADLVKVKSTKYVEQDENKKIESVNDIIINNICYRYPNTNENIFENVSFNIKKGSSVGFVGATGAGKTTMIDVILGLLNPTKGNITVNGIDIHKNKKSWFSKLGYVPQFIYLTDDTIKNNILFYDDENVDNEKLNLVIEQSQLKNFIDSLPNGVDTVVGERGIRLSGGQRQRIGIARALYNNPEILVLDEATSALDNETEKAVIESIEYLYGKITMLVIAHRLTTIEKCDEIYKLENGTIHKVR